VERAEGLPPTTLVQDIGEGLRWLAGHRLLLTLAFVLATAGFAVEGVFAILVLYAQEVLGVGEVGYGVLATGFAVGGILGSLLSDRISSLLGVGMTISVIFLLECAAFAGLALTSSFHLAFALLALDAFAGTVWNVVTISLRQAVIPEALLGRVGSAFRMIGLGGMSFGVLASGLVAREVGITAPYWLAAGIMAALSLLCALTVTNRAVDAARSDAGL
jgi:predicted MFS family arabinose efflux permease